jgi:hypothetical protein
LARWRHQSILFRAFFWLFKLALLAHWLGSSTPLFGMQASQGASDSAEELAYGWNIPEQGQNGPAPLDMENHIGDSNLAAVNLISMSLEQTDLSHVPEAAPGLQRLKTSTGYLGFPGRVQVANASELIVSC